MIRALPIVIIVAFCLAFSAHSAAQSWTIHDPATKNDLVAVYFTSADRGWIAGDGGYLASTSDGGSKWTRYPLNVTDDITEIYFRNEKNGYLVAGRKMFATSDAGRIWSEIAIVRPGEFRNGIPEFLSIRFANKNRGHVIGSVLNRRGDVIDSLVLRTDDGGLTWHRIPVPSRGELYHLDFTGNSRGWIVGDGGVILATTDGGQTWRLQNSNTKSALFNVDFRDEELGYAVGEKGTILRTENGGGTWTKVPTGNITSLMRVDFPDDKNGWIVGHGGTVLRSMDKGRTWTREDSGTAAHLYGLYITKKYGFAVGSKGIVLNYREN